MGNKKLKYPRRNLKDLRFGRLQVIEFIEYLEVNNHRHDFWLCKCDCGNNHKVRGNVLISKKTKSCGCLLKENYEKLKEKTTFRNKKPYGEAALNGLYSSYKLNAKVKNNEFNLSKEEFKDIIEKNCYYCGIKPHKQYPTDEKLNGRKTNGVIIYNGIDRVDNNQGYKTANIVAACEICNKAKRNLTTEEFEKWIQTLINYWKVKIK